MRVSNINPNVSFKRVTLDAYRQGLRENRANKQEITDLVVQSHTAINYEVDYNKEKGYYTVKEKNKPEIPFNYNPPYKKIDKTFQEAVARSLMKQNEYNEYLKKNAARLTDEQLISLCNIK